MPNIKHQGHSDNQQEHLTKDGEPDHRYKENRNDNDQQSSGHGQEHMTKEGEPDHRYKENRNDSNQRSSGHGQEHMTKEGEPDHRYKENRDDGDSQRQQSHQNNEDHPVDLAEVPVKLDGTADMRFVQSRDAVAAGLISKDDVVAEVMDGVSE